MLKLLFQCLARLPLPALHLLGNILGRLIFYLSPYNRERVRTNLTIAQLPNDDVFVMNVLQETVKSGLELPIAFFRQPEKIAALFVATYGWEYVEQAMNKQQGLLLITPHLGSYDLAGRFISERLPFTLTAMYKPPKWAVLDAVMQAGRKRGKGNTAPTNLQGVKQIIKALRQGEATIVLPDHVPDPNEGNGVWVEFFGRDALTMTLVGKLAQVQNVCPLFFVGERLTNGRGFVLHIAPIIGELNGDKVHDAQVINHNVEYWVRRFPKQYLFAYNRYKTPAGA